jgi:hypothetical protein
MKMKYIFNLKYQSEHSPPTGGLGGILECKHFLSYMVIFFIFLSCEDVFKVDERNVLKLESDKDFSVAISGLYGQLIKSVYSEKICCVGGILKETIGNGDDISIFSLSFQTEDFECISCQKTFSLASTILDSNFGGFGHSGCSCSYVTNGDEYYSKSYKLLFQTIGDANNIISKVNASTNLNVLKKNVVGETYLIRAYCYFRLARVYGQVPIVTNVDVDFTLKKPSFSELYNFIVGDLQKAIELLPQTIKEARVPYETPTIGSAKALLAEVYLTMGGYPLYDKNGYVNAAKIAEDVIVHSEEYGFVLVEDLANLWNGKLVKNSESVFALFLYKDLFSNDYDYKQMYFNVAAPPDFYNLFPKNYRKETTFQTRHVPYILGCGKYYPGCKIYDSLYIKHYDTISPFVCINYKKIYTKFDIPDSVFLKVKPEDYFNELNNINAYDGQVVYLIRYAQTLLTYAEAKARSGALDASAYEAVNKIRRRANKLNISTPSQFDLKPGLTAEQFADSVVQERAWELCAEPEGRWFDMVRLNIAKDLVAIKHHQGIMVYPFPIDRTTFFLPIPEEDKKYNPNLQ